ncbi:MAG: prenyltransferase [Dehalococcoidia bacterium]|nr:prenyltransferase [Dehalococcoidia bacterium]
MDSQADIEGVLAKRHDNGGDFWASADGRLAVGSPFSTLEALQILHELGVEADHEAVRGALDLLVGAWREDGRYRLAPSGTLYPCYTANTARILGRFGLADDSRVQRSLAHLLETPHDDGGWRCSKFAFGRGPETDSSNPGVTLFVLDAFRFTEQLDSNPLLDGAVETLLDHWTVRRPTGPCHFGIGTLFMQVEYPFLRYNIFSYVYVLSFYERARSDDRFFEALEVLGTKLDDEGRVVVERPNRKLAAFSAFAKGQPSEQATRRYGEIMENLL